MKTVCTCGFDYGDFVAQHQIPDDAKFSCPGCDTELQIANALPALESADADLALRGTAASRDGPLSGGAAQCT
jgi:hypothetical protein